MAKTTKKKAKPARAAGAKTKQRAARAQPAPGAELVFPPGAQSDVLDRLHGVVMSRRDADPEVSHSARLLSRGTAKVAQKFGEEAVECLIEAVAGNRQALIGESADVLYHLIVLWVNAEVDPREVWAELHRREGISGIAEKASRSLATRKIP